MGAGTVGARPASWPREPEPDLGAIASFTGTFKGTGFNTIFRPQDFAVTPTPLPNPAHGPDDNILELNLTEETLSFSPALGSIPNRGMVQGDVFLNGIPYLQTINDVSDPAPTCRHPFRAGRLVERSANNCASRGRHARTHGVYSTRHNHRSAGNFVHRRRRPASSSPSTSRPSRSATRAGRSGSQART